MNLLQRARTLYRGIIGNTSIQNSNEFNRSFYQFVGNAYTAYDDKGTTYIDKGYNLNSIVFAIINQMMRKTASVPYYLKDLKDEQQYRQALVNLKNVNLNNPLSIIQAIKTKNMAFETGNKTLPLDKPNPNQTWPEFFAQVKGFLKVNGNAYIYKVRVDEGLNAGKPLALYVLPSDKISIVLKPDASFLLLENPVAEYMLIYGAKYQTFATEDVCHIKYGNLNFDMNGAHLYGQSPLKAALRNIQSSNEAVNNNIKTMNNGGAFGLIYGKGTPLEDAQAKQLKQRLIEMDSDPGRLGKIAGVSSEVGFLRMSLTSDELKPFEYLKYYEKQLCNVLGWNDKLLNNDQGAKYDNVIEAKKEVLINDILPDLHLIAEAFNTDILPNFGKEFENMRLFFDVTEAPEMQDDIKMLVDWIVLAVRTGLITRNEARAILKYEQIEDASMNVLTVDQSIQTLEDAILSPTNLTVQPNDRRTV
jgi:HK97 family phage portal protein